MNNRTIVAVAVTVLAIGSVVGSPAVANATSERKVGHRIVQTPFGKTNDRTEPMPFGKTNSRQVAPRDVPGPGFYRLFGLKTN